MTVVDGFFSALGPICRNQAGIEILLVDLEPDDTIDIFQMLVNDGFIAVVDENESVITFSVHVFRPWPQDYWSGPIEMSKLGPVFTRLGYENWGTVMQPFGPQLLPMNREFSGLAFEFVGEFGLVLRFMTGLRGRNGIKEILHEYRSEISTLIERLAIVHKEAVELVVYAEGQRFLQK